MTMKPMYTHDCDECTYLGVYDAHGMYKDLKFDLYYHYRPNCSEVVARYGNDGPEYYSSNIEFKEVLETNDALQEAVERAKRL